MKKILILLLLSSFLFSQVYYLNTSDTRGTNLITNMLIDSGYLTNETGGGSGGVSATVITLRGNAYVKTNITGFLCPADTSIKSVRATVGTAPTGADILIDFSVGGSSIFASTNGALHITNATTSNTGIAPAQNSNVSIGDQIYVTVHQVGSTVPGGDDLLILIEYNYLPWWMILFLPPGILARRHKWLR